MRKSIIMFMVGALLGSTAGFALGIFVYPYIFLADIVAADRVDDKTARKIAATGAFVHANLRDPVHYGKGKVTVYQDLVHLGNDVEVGPGPKFH